MKFSIKLAAFCLLMTVFAFSATAQNQKQIDRQTEKAKTETAAVAAALELDEATTAKFGEVEQKYAMERMKIDMPYWKLKKENGDLTDEQKAEKRTAFKAMYKEKNTELKPILGDKMKAYQAFLAERRAAKKAANKG